MTCFQISTFVGLSTGANHYGNIFEQLWLAFKLVPLLGYQQGSWGSQPECWVVTCFQISTFVGLSTGVDGRLKNCDKLWLAFKLVPLLGYQQVIGCTGERCYSCDLLSN